MKGKLNKINGKWFVEYSTVSYTGGNPKILGSYSKKIEPKRLELTPNNQRYLNCFLQVDKDTRVKFKEVFINPMGREVDPNNLGQNHSGCVWYAELIDDDDVVKSAQIQHIVDMMKGDEELGLYGESREIKPEDIFNDEKREGFKEFISKYPKSITKGELIDRYIDETGYGMDMWSKTENETFTTIIKILYERK
jgi:hypothetical protein